MLLFALPSPAVHLERAARPRGARRPAYARGEVETRERPRAVEVEIPDQGRDRVQVNRSPVRRKRELRRQVRAVFFGPDDLGS